MRIQCITENIDQEIRKGLIAPHDGRELELMLAGEKPTALVANIGKFRYDIAHKNISLIGKLGKNRYVVSLPNKEKQGRELLKAFKSLLSLFSMKEIGEYRNPDDLAKLKILHYKIGSLLGYPRKSIDYFIKTRLRNT